MEMQNCQRKNFYDILKKYQPLAVGGGCSGNEAYGYDCGPDTAWIGNEGGSGRDPSYSTHPGSCEFTNKSVFAPYYVNTSTRKGWFFHPGEDFICPENKSRDDCYGVKSLKTLVETYYQSVGQNSVLILNLPPNRDGLISDKDVTQTRKLGAYIRALYHHDYVEKTIHEAANVYVAELEKSVKGKCLGNVIMLQEHLLKGQSIATFTIQSTNETLKNWLDLTSGNTIGYKRLLRLNTIQTQQLCKASKIKVTITSTIANFNATISKIAVLHAPSLEQFAFVPNVPNHVIENK